MSRLPRTHTPKNIRELESFKNEYEFALRREVEVFNLSLRPVRVLFRDGVAYDVAAPSTWLRDEGVVVRVFTKRTINGLVKFDPRPKILSNQPASRGAKLAELIASSDERISGLREGANANGLDYFVSSEDLARAGGSLYVEEADVTIAFSAHAADAVHPFSEAGKCIHKGESGYWNGKRSSMMFCADIIDNDFSIGDRFVNIAGKVFRIPSRQDATLSNGVYIDHTFEDGNLTLTRLMESNSYDVDADDLPVRLYRTYEEALYDGDPRKHWEEVMSNESKKLQQDNITLKRELEELKATNERNKAEREERKAERDEKNEEKTSAMKMAFEILTWTAKIATTVVSLIAIFMAAGSKSK